MLRGGAAEQAGLAPGDELLAVAGWRLRRLDDALRVLAADGERRCWSARDQRVRDAAADRRRARRHEAGAVSCAAPTTPTPTAQALQEAWLAG